MPARTTRELFDMDPSSQPPAHVIRVALATGADQCFDYAVPEALWPVEPGCRVAVPFGKGDRTVQGFCVEVLDDAATDQRAHFRLKAVKRVLDAEPLLDAALLDLARWISDYYVCPLGQTLEAMVPAAVKKDIGVKTDKRFYLAGDAEPDPPLRSHKQRRILEILREHGATDADHTMPAADLLALAECGSVPLMNLRRAGLVKMTRHEVYRALPAVPAGLYRDEAEVTLNADQERCLAAIETELVAGRFGVSLLHGVTDSGKTEVYIRAVEKTLAQGTQAIVLLPEIALTAQTVNRFGRRFGRIAVMHSRLTAAQRNAQWRTIRAGQADVVIGARSAVFAPVRRLGLIVVDEEHEPGYKQDSVPRYHARDVAIKRAQAAGAHCLLGSATPSLESLYNSRHREHFQLLQLPRRVLDRPMPAMHLVDMTAEAHSPARPRLLSDALEEALRETLDRGEQAILLLNRRGYSSFIFCPRCHYCLQCRQCDVTLTFHKRPDRPAPQDPQGRPFAGGVAVCHYCLSKTLVPTTCPLCGGGMIMLGLGSQRLAEEVGRRLPQARVLRIDSDAMETGGPDRYYEVLEDFAAGRVDVLAGTQILAKGLHFPNVTLVGIISADTALMIPDFRANERTFQLISQVAGRSGRAEKPGRVIVQTFLPDQPAIRFAIQHDFEGFVEAELAHRRQCRLPPYWRLALVHLRDAKFDRLEAACKEMARRIDEIIAARRLDVRVRGPMPATISRMHGRHRMQIVLQAPNPHVMGRLLADLRAYAPLRPAVQVLYDVDAVHLL